MSDDKAIIVSENGIYSKRTKIFKGHVNRQFDNVNYMEHHENVEYDEYDDDETRPVVANGDIV